ncbi:MAG TPA: hypothetical protein VHI13_17480 [Candidatus Kapabacteria bacterium]|nr:hypothetical protein [Candidatus Kapabacteria bacterium]
MITKKDIVGAIVHEWNVAKFLAGKIPPDGFDYRPSEKQRSVIELMRYIVVMPMATLRGLLNESFSAGFRSYAEHANDMTPEQFPAMVDAAIAEFTAAVEGIDDEEFSTRMVALPTRQVMPLDVALMFTAVKWSASYKMQLFLYAKALGASDMGTIQAWAGMDPQPRPEAAPAA